MKKILLFVFSGLLSVSAIAQEKKKIYRWVDENGNVHFTDEPRKGAEELKMKEVPTVNMTPPAPLKPIQSADNKKQEPKFVKYTLARVVSPSKDGVVRNNARILTVDLAIEPALGTGHSVRIFVDGKPVKETEQTSGIKIEKLEFGEHTISFAIINQDGKVVFNSQSNSFHLLNFVNPKRRGK